VANGLRTQARKPGSVRSLAQPQAGVLSMLRAQYVALLLATACAEGGEPNAPTFSPPSRTVAWPNEVRLTGSGDLAWCFNNGDEATAELLDTLPGTVFTAGDNVYREGTASQFANCYDPTWGP
jgi:hypothetical protein